MSFGVPDTIGGLEDDTGFYKKKTSCFETKHTSRLVLQYAMLFKPAVCLASIALTYTGTLAVAVSDL